MYEFLGWLTWIFPFVGALLTPVLAKIGPKARNYGAIGFSFLGALSAGLLIPFALFKPPQDLQVNWIQSLNIKAGILVDPLSIIMVNVVSWISFLIMVYSLAWKATTDSRDIGSS
jgi:NADH-quinone oxidoreductase subunit L